MQVARKKFIQPMLIGIGLLSQLAQQDVRGDQRHGWPGWRGPTRNGIAPATANPPSEWTDSQNVAWKTPIPGRGHSSPVVIDDCVLLTTADEQSQIQSVVCFDRQTGSPRWQTPILEGGFPAKIHAKNTHATPTVAAAGGRVFASFYNAGKIELAALDLKGRRLWQITAGPHLPKQYQFGYAASPLVYQSMVIVAADADGGGFLAAFDQRSGKEVWRTERPKITNYASPVIGRVAGRDQLLISGGQRIVSHDPATGKQRWACPAVTAATCGTVVWTDELVLGSGGYPNKQTTAVRGDGSNEILWRNEQKCYEQSMLVHEGFVYAVNDSGIAICWNVVTGEQMWRKRLAGAISASPVLAGGNLYVGFEDGKVFVFEPNPRRFALVAQNQLGDELFASPAAVGDQLIWRVAHRQNGSRQELLYCLSEPK